MYELLGHAPSVCEMVVEIFESSCLLLKDLSLLSLFHLPPSSFLVVLKEQTLSLTKECWKLWRSWLCIPTMERPALKCSKW